MELQELSFCKAIKINNDLAEFIVDEGVEFSLPMVKEYHDWILNNLTKPCLILVNKINSYTYTIDALQEVGTIPEIKAIAFVVYSRVSEITTESVTDFPRDTVWNSRIFNNREEAFHWLEGQR